MFSVWNCQGTLNVNSKFFKLHKVVEIYPNYTLNFFCCEEECIFMTCFFQKWFLCWIFFSHGLLKNEGKGVLKIFFVVHEGKFFMIFQFLFEVLWEQDIFVENSLGLGNNHLRAKSFHNFHS